jgi:hypothetical protein
MGREGSARHRAGHGHSASARSRLGVPARGKRPFRRIEVVGGDHAARQYCRRLSRASSPGEQVVSNALVLQNTVGAAIDDSRASRFRAQQPILVVAFAVLLFIWGGISFHNLPVEAYPDVANNYVEVITQWPGISAEQIEQQVTIPLEIVMNGIPHLTALRSFSLFGLSDLKLIFDDESENDWNREKVLERLAGDAARRRAAADGHGLEPGGPDLLLHAAQHQSEATT